MVAAAPPQYSGRSVLDGDTVGGPSATPTISPNHTSSGASRHPRGFKLNLFSGTASAALFASLALCLVLICAYSYVSRRRAISGTRRRFLGRVRDLDLVPGSGRSSLSLPRVALATARPFPPVAKTTLSSPAVRGAGTSSGPAGDCPVCLEPLRGGGKVTATHACGHVFHVPCIEPWLRRRDSCPVCRCTVSCDAEAAAAPHGGGAPQLRQTMVVVITAETPAWAAGSDGDEMLT